MALPPFAGNAVLSGHSSINISSNTTISTWSQHKGVIYKVHRHVCNHSTFPDMITLLRRNKIWTDDAQNYLGDFIRRCTSCVASSTPPPTRKVSCSSINHSLNDVFMIDHVLLSSVSSIAWVHNLDSLVFPWSPMPLYSVPQWHSKQHRLINSGRLWKYRETRNSIIESVANN